MINKWTSQAMKKMLTICWRSLSSIRLKFLSYLRKLQWLQALKKVEEENVLKLHTYLKGRETSIYDLESHISHINVEIEELKQSLQSTRDYQYLTNAKCQIWGKIISQMANFKPHFKYYHMTKAILWKNAQTSIKNK